MSIFTIIVFILIFSLLIIVHEFGHYFMAKRAGMKVEEFGLGIPPRLFGKKKWGTLWSFNLLPIGGFVRVKGADKMNVDKKDKKDKENYHSKSLFDRLLFVLGGVMMNFLFAILLLTFLYTIGVEPIFGTKLFDEYKKVDGIYVSQVSEGAGADGILQVSDLITHVNGVLMLDVDEFISNVQASKDSFVEFSIQRPINAEDEEVIYDTLNLSVPVSSEGKIGIGLMEKVSVEEVAFPIWKSVIISTVQVYEISVLTIKMVGQQFSRFSLDGMSGPVGLVKATSHVIDLGYKYVIKLAAILSISIGVFNLLPIPALDGARALFLTVEGIIKRPIPPRFEMFVHGIGFLFLIFLMVLVTISDIKNF